MTEAEFDVSTFLQFFGNIVFFLAIHVVGKPQGMMAYGSEGIVES